jgi:uncharacterized protein YecT (DUF1311 family)
MSTRDRTGEILDVKARDPFRHRFGSYSLESLKSQWMTTYKSEGSVPDFYVIRAVTLLEVFTRGNIAELIDHGTEYANRAIELAKNLKMDFALVQGVQGRAITLGDIVAHSVSVNSFGQIVGYFETLLDKKPLRPLLADAVDRWATEIEQKPSAPIISDYDDLARSLTRLFEVRHILCHETPKKPVYAAREVEEFLNQAIRFTKSLEEVLTFEMFGLTPLTQTEMNIAAGNNLRKKEEELNDVLVEIQAKVRVTDDARSRLATPSPDDSWSHSLDDTQEKWLSYRNAQCDFDTYLNQGGTIRPTLWAGEATRLTEIRIGELRSWLRREAES